MPAIDTELVEPLTAITDTLRRRPGVATMQSIKKLSETYGFTTFVEHIRGEGGATGGGGSVIRMSISGHVLLIDIDFKIPVHLEGGLGSPMSPSAASGSLLGEFSGLDRTSITHVSISSAITPDLIDGVNWDFLVGFGEGGKGLSCSDVLYDNLTKEKTMDAFNKNLRVLLQFDRLSGTKPYDLFTVFSELACGMTKQIQLDETGDVQEKEDGVYGLGKVLCNHGGKVGLFLKYWVDDRYVNRWIRENKGLDVDEQEYLLHFKVKESLKREDEEEREAVKEEKDGDSVMDIDSAVHGTRLFNVDFGEWNVEKDSKIEECLNNITLELCPPVWVPEDLLLEFGVEYETIVPGRYGNYSADRVDEVYSAVNESGEYRGKGGNVSVSMLVGCPMLLVHKTTLGDLNQLQTFVQSLRTWCKLASVLRKLPTADGDALGRRVRVEVSCGDLQKVDLAVDVDVDVDVDADVDVDVDVKVERGLNVGETVSGKKRRRDLRFAISVAEGKVLFGEERCGGSGESGQSGGARDSSSSSSSTGAGRAVELTETLLW